MLPSPCAVEHSAKYSIARLSVHLHYLKLHGHHNTDTASRCYPSHRTSYVDAEAKKTHEGDGRSVCHEAQYRDDRQSHPSFLESILLSLPTSVFVQVSRHRAHPAFFFVGRTSGRSRNTLTCRSPPKNVLHEECAKLVYGKQNHSSDHIIIGDTNATTMLLFGVINSFAMLLKRIMDLHPCFSYQNIQF